MDNPYRDESFVVGRERELDELCANIRRGESTLLIGGRRAGKTTLLSRIPEVGRRVLITSTESWVLTDERTALGHLATALGVELPPAGDLSDARRAFQDGMRGKLPACVAIDEADRILGEPWAGSFLVYLRALINSIFRFDLALVLAGGPVLNGYANPDDQGSPPLNLAERLYLAPLDANALEQFAKPLRDRYPLAEIRNLAGAHPWLLRRLLRELWIGSPWNDAWGRTVDGCHHTFPVWQKQLGGDGVALIRDLPEAGVAKSAFLTDPRWIRYRDALVRAQYLCAVVEDGDIVRPGPRMFLDWLAAGARERRAWDLAISYASEDVELARRIHDRLKHEFNVFFADAQQAYLWGQKLSRVLPNTYGEMARYVLVLSTEAYLRKHWTLFEFRAAIESGRENVLVLELGGLPDDLPSDVAYVNGNAANLVELVDGLKQRLRTGR